MDGKGHMQVIDTAELDRTTPEKWTNFTLSVVNDSLIRMGIFEGEFHWHKHDHEDEFFFILEGTLFLDIEDSETITLDPHCGYTVPRGVMHRPRAPQKTVMLMVEGSGVNPVGD